MASGFGTTYISSTRCSSGGAVVAATLSQSVNTSARTVTVTLRVTAAYYRSVNRDWIPGAGVAVYGSDHTGNRVTGRIGNTTTTLKTGGKVGLQSVSNKTYKYNTKYSIPAKEVAVRSGYEADWSMSKTYNYNTNGDAITDSWYASMYLPGQGSTTSEIGGDTSKFTTDSIPAAATPPSGGSCSLASRAWDSVGINASVSSWGSGYDSDKTFLAQCVCSTSATSSNWLQTARRVKWTNTTNKSVSGTVTNGNSTQYNGGVDIKGCLGFKIAGYGYSKTGTTEIGNTWSFIDTIYYLPPAPLASVTYSQTNQATNVAINITITGNSSTYNHDVNVTTQYKYSVDNGAYTDWISAGSGKPWAEKKVTNAFTCPYGKAVKIKARQVYQNQGSEEYDVSFTSNAASAPSSLRLSIDGSTYNSITLSGSCSYGDPSGINGRYICLGVNANGTSLAGRTEIGYGNSTSGSGTVDNSSTKKDGGVDLKGMLPVYPYIYANNTIKSALLLNTVYYLPPAPGALTYTEPPVGVTTYPVRYTGVAANNVTNYDTSELRRTVRYKAPGASTWTVVVNNAIVSLTSVTGFNIELQAQESAQVEAWMTYRGKESEHSNMTISNSDDPVYIYAPVEGQRKRVKHIYAPVNGARKKIVRVYASVNGVARKVFEDGS